MDEDDINENPFEETGDITYVSKFQKIDTSLNKLITEVIALQESAEADGLGPCTSLYDAIDRKLLTILRGRIEGDGINITTSYSEETGILTISLVS